MIKNYLILTYQETLGKYQLYYGRLQKKIKNGSLKKLTASRRNFLLSKIEELRKKLELLKPQLAGYAAAGILAVTLGANTASAQFTEVTGTSNPLSVVSATSSYSPNPTFADVDGDGDKDLLVGDYNNLLYYKNTGTATSPTFTLQTGTTNDPFYGVAVASGYQNYLAPSLGDMDGDGDIDLLLGTDDNYGEIQYFKNTGSNSAPNYVRQTGTTDNIIPAIVGYERDELVPYIIDIDKDGDNDIFIGEENDSQIYFIKNIGSATSPNYVQQTGTFNPFDGNTAAGGDYRAQPAFADCDGDGDIDALVGNSDGGSVYYRNTGTNSAPVFTSQTGTNNPFDGISNYYEYFVPAFVDLDGDGDQDLALGNDDVIRYFKNNNPVTSRKETQDVSGKLVIYPTMTSGDLSITVPSELTGTVEISITNVAGISIYTSTVNANGSAISLNGVLSTAENGMYIVSLKNDNATAKSKVVKF